MPICQWSRCHPICVLFKINYKFTLLKIIIDKISISLGFNELFVWWSCSSLHAWMHSLNTQRTRSLKKLGDHVFEAAGSKCPPPQDLQQLLEKRMFPAMCLHFICKRWLHSCSLVRNETCIPLTSKVVWCDNSWMEEFCFSNYWHCLPVLFKNLNSFSSSFSLRLCIPLP